MKFVASEWWWWVKIFVDGGLMSWLFWDDCDKKSIEKVTLEIGFQLMSTRLLRAHYLQLQAVRIPLRADQQRRRVVSRMNWMNIYMCNRSLFNCLTSVLTLLYLIKFATIQNSIMKNLTHCIDCDDGLITVYDNDIWRSYSTCLRFKCWLIKSSCGFKLFVRSVVVILIALQLLSRIC